MPAALSHLPRRGCCWTTCGPMKGLNRKSPGMNTCTHFSPDEARIPIKSPLELVETQWRRKAHRHCHASQWSNEIHFGTNQKCLSGLGLDGVTLISSLQLHLSGILPNNAGWSGKDSAGEWIYGSNLRRVRGRDNDEPLNKLDIIAVKNIRRKASSWTVLFRHQEPFHRKEHASN